MGKFSDIYNAEKSTSKTTSKSNTTSKKTFSQMYNEERKKKEEEQKKASSVSTTSTPSKTATHGGSGGKSYNNNYEIQNDDWNKLTAVSKNDSTSRGAYASLSRKGYTDEYINNYSKIAGYGNLKNNADYAENSKGDNVYKEEYKNQNAYTNYTASTTGDSNLPIFSYVPDKDKTKDLNVLNDEERSNFNYLYNTKGRESAEEYYDTIINDVNKRRQKEEIANMESDYEQMSPTAQAVVGVGGTVAGFVGQTLGNTIATAKDAYDMASSFSNNLTNYINERKQNGTDENTPFLTNAWNTFKDINGMVKDYEINPYDEYHDMKNEVSAFRNMIGNKIEQNTELEFMGQNVARKAYEIINSAADSKIGGLAFGAPYTVLMGVNAFTDRVEEGVKNGEDKEVALKKASIEGAAETLSEIISLELILKTGIGKNFLETAWNFIKLGIDEGSEEVASDLFKDFWESKVDKWYGEVPEMQQQVQTLVANGMDEKSAEKQVIKEKIRELGWSFISGAGAGLLGGTGATIANVNNVRTLGKDIREKGETENVLKTIAENTKGKVKTASQEYLAKIGRKEKLSDLNVGGLTAQAIEQLDEEYAKNKKAYDKEDKSIEKAKAEQMEIDAKNKKADSENDFVKMAVSNPAISINGKTTTINGNNIINGKYDSTKTNVFTDVDGKAVAKGSVDGKTYTAKEIADSTKDYNVKALYGYIAENNLLADQANLLVSNYDGESNVDAYVKAYDAFKKAGELGASDGFLEAVTFGNTYSDYFTKEQQDKIMSASLANKPLKVGLTDYTTRAKSNSTKIQIKVVDSVAKALGKEVVLFDDLKGNEGRLYNGANLGNGRIALSSQAEGGLILRSFAHEIGHSIKQSDSKAFAELREVVQATADAKGIDLNKNVQKYKNSGYDESQIYDELICDSLYNVLFDEKVLRKVLGNNISSIALSKAVKKILPIYESSINSMMKMGKSELAMLNDNKEALRKISDIFASADKSGVKETTETEEGTFRELDDVDFSVNFSETHMEKLKSQWSNASIGNLDEQLKQYKNVVDIWNKISKEIKSEFLDSWNNQSYKERAFTVFKAQSGYKYHIELSSMCKKGVPLFEAVDMIVRKAVMEKIGLESIGKEEKQILYDVLKKNGYEIPCGICYVEQARQREAKVISEFLNGKIEVNSKGVENKHKLGWNETLERIQKEMRVKGISYKFPKLSRDIATESFQPTKLTMDEKTQKAFYESLIQISNEEIDRYNADSSHKTKKPHLKDGSPKEVASIFKGTLSANMRLLKTLFENPNSRFLIDNDLLYSSVTTANLAGYYKDLYKLFNTQGGVSGYKLKQKPIAYLGDLLGKSWAPGTIRREGGIRNQSNSDYQMYTFIDQMQMYVDATAKGYYLQAYTKVISELKLFGLSNAKINASLIPMVVLRYVDGKYDAELTAKYAGLDENMNPIYDDVEGINSAEAFALIEDENYSKSISGTCIGYSDEHIKKLLDDDRIQQIIGYHDNTDDPEKRYKYAYFAHNYNGENEATKGPETIHIGFNQFVIQAEKMMKSKKPLTRDADTRINGAWKTEQKTYEYNDIPMLAADLYLSYCKEKGYSPAYDIDGIVDHNNYYKLLADFGLKNSKGEYAPHQKVNFILPESVPMYGGGRMDTKDYIKMELLKELETRDNLARDLADDSENGIISQYERALKERNNESQNGTVIPLDNSYLNEKYEIKKNGKGIPSSVNLSTREVSPININTAGWNNVNEYGEVVDTKWYINQVDINGNRLFRLFEPNESNKTEEQKELEEKGHKTQNAMTMGSYKKFFGMIQKQAEEKGVNVSNMKILDASSGLGLGTRYGRDVLGLDIIDVEPFASPNKYGLDMSIFGDKRYPATDKSGNQKYDKKGNPQWAEYVDAGTRSPDYTDYGYLESQIEKGNLEKFDAIISNMVINVTPYDQRNEVVASMGRMLKNGGKLYINTMDNNMAESQNAITTIKAKYGSDGKIISGGEYYKGQTNTPQKGFTETEMKAYLNDVLTQTTGAKFDFKYIKSFGSNSTTFVVTKIGDGISYKEYAKKNNIEFSTREFGMPIKTNGGGVVERFNGVVGKNIGTKSKPWVYFHAQYVDDMIRQGVFTRKDFEKALRVLKNEHPKLADNYNHMAYQADENKFTFAYSDNFDTAREPKMGETFWVNLNTGKTSYSADNKRILHHKWAWVKNDYDGFDVQKSWEWSNKYIPLLEKHPEISGYGASKGIPDGTNIEKWTEQLNAHESLRQYANDVNGNAEYSTRDSNGNELSPQQQEFFKDSKVRDEDGNLKVMYHGTSNYGFNVFDYGRRKYGMYGGGFYFTENENIGKEYTEKGRGDNPGVYQVYLNITNPMDMDKTLDIYGEDFKKWCNLINELGYDGDSIREVAREINNDLKGIDLGEAITNAYMFYQLAEQISDDETTTVDDAMEILESTIRGLGYDGMTHIGGGRHSKSDGTKHRVYIALDQEQIKNIDNKNPTSDPDIRYSTRDVDGQISFEDVPNSDAQEVEQLTFDTANFTTEEQIKKDSDSELVDKIKEFSRHYQDKEKMYKFFDENPSLDFVERYANKETDKFVKTDFKRLFSLIDSETDLNLVSSIYRRLTYNKVFDTRSFELVHEYRGAEKWIKTMITKRRLEIEKTAGGNTSLGMKGIVYDSKQIHEMFNKVNKDKDLEELANRVFATTEKLGIKFKGDANYKDSSTGGTSLGHRVRYDMYYMNNSYNSDVNKATTLLHEAIHACTTYALKNTNDLSDPNMQRAAEIIKGVYDKISGLPILVGEYGIQDSYEMTAELANERFRNKMRQIDVGGSDALDTISTAIKIIFNIDANDSLSMASIALDYIIDHPDAEKSKDYYDYAHKVKGQFYDTWNFSVRDDMSGYYSEVIRENRRLQTILASLGDAYSSIRKDTYVSKDRVRSYAQELVNKYNSTMDVNALTDRIYAVYDWIDAQRKTNKGYQVVDTEQAVMPLREIANDIMMTSTVVDTTKYDMSRPLRKYLREHTLYVTEEESREIPDFMAEKKLLGGRVRVSIGEYDNRGNKRVHLADAWNILCELSGGTEVDGGYEYVGGELNPDTNQKDMLRELFEYFQSHEKTFVTGDQAINAMFNMGMLDSTEAEADVLASEMLENHLKMISEKEPTANQKLTAFLHDLEMQTVQLRENYKNDAKKSYEEKLQAYKDKREMLDDKRVLRNKIQRDYNYVSRRWREQSAQYHITENMKGLAEKYLKSFVMANPKAQVTRFDKVAMSDLARQMRLDFKDDADIVELAQKLEKFSDEYHEAKYKGYAYDTDALANISVEDLQTISNVSAFIKHRIEVENNLVGERRKEDLRAVAESVHKEYSSMADKTIANINPNDSTKAKIWSMSNKINLGLTKPYYLVQNCGSSTMKGLLQDILYAENTEGRILDGAKQAIVKAKENNKYDPRWKDAKVKLTLGGQFTEITVEDAMSLYALSKRPQALQHLLSDGIEIYSVNKDGDRELVKRRMLIDELRYLSETVLPDNAKSYVDEVVGYITKEIGSERNKITEALYGFKKYTEEYYFPIKVSSNERDANSVRSEELSALKNGSATKSVSENAKQAIVVDGFSDTVYNHIYTSAMYCAYVLPIENFTKVLNYRYNPNYGEIYGDILQGGKSAAKWDIQTDIKTKMGTNYFSSIMDLVRDVNSGNISPQKLVLMNKFITNMKKASTMANISVVVQQPMAVVRAFMYVEPKYFGKTTKADMDEMYANNGAALKKDIGYFDVNMGRSVTDWLDGDYTPSEDLQMTFKERVKSGEIKDTINELAGWGANKADEITWVAIWKACRNKVKAENGNLSDADQMAKASKLFSNVVGFTQVYDSVFSKCSHMRNKDSAAQMLMSFKAEPITTLNMIAQASHDYITNKNNYTKKRFFTALTCFVGSMVATNLTKAMWGAFRDDDDEYSWLEKVIAKLSGGVIGDVFGLLPYLGDIYNVMQGYDITRMDTNWITTLIGVVNQATKEDVDGTKLINKILELLSQLSGYPIYAAKRDATTIIRTGKNVISDVIGYRDMPTTTADGMIEALQDEFSFLN